jgi:hypothetical protein
MTHLCRIGMLGASPTVPPHVGFSRHKGRVPVSPRHGNPHIAVIAADRDGVISMAR